MKPLKGMGTHRWNRSPRPSLGLTLAMLLCLPRLGLANGTAYYLDVDGTNPGFGSPAGTYDENGANWSTDATGASGTLALPNDAQLTFGAAASDLAGAYFTVNMNSSRWSGLVVNSSSANITLNGTANAYLSGAQTWTVAAGSTLTEAISWSAGALNFNNAPLTLAGGGTINFQTSLGYNSTAAITENDAGLGLTVNLYATNLSFSGGFTLTSGRLNFAAAAPTALGSGTFTLNGGTLDNLSGAPLTLSGMSGIAVGNNFTFTGSSSLNLGSAPVTLNASPTITVNANLLTLGGNISGSGRALTKAGAGALALPGINTYNGSTTISAGELLGWSGGSCSNSALTVASGATNGVRLLPQGPQWVCAGLTNSVGGFLEFVFDAVPSTTTAPLLVNGNVALSSARVMIRGSAVITPGTYPLLKYTNSFFGSLPTLLSLPPFMAATLVNNSANKSIDLNVTAGNQLAWAVGNGSWDIGTTANWKAGGLATTYADGQTVLFDDSASGASPITVSVDTTVNPAGVTANLTNKNYVLTGFGAIAGSTALFKAGPGTLTLNGANSFSGGTVLSGGTLQLANYGALGDPAAPLTVTGGSLDLGGNGPSVGTLSLSGGSVQNGSLVASSIAANPDAGSTAVVSASLTDTGPLALSGAGALGLNGDTSLSGPVTITGTLNLNGSYNTITTSGSGAFFLGLNGGNGTINQFGGNVYLGQNYGSYSLLMGNGTPGTLSTYNLYGGTLNTTAGLGLGINSGCSALFRMTNGTLTAASSLEIGRNYASTTATTNTFIQSGGSVTVNNLYVAANNDQVSYLNLTNCSFSASNFVKLASSPGTRAQLNFGPGAVVTLGPIPTPDPSALGNVTLMLDGCTLSPSRASSLFLPANTFATAKVTSKGVTVAVPAGNDITIGQALGNSGLGQYGKLTKVGAGTLSLTAANSYKGATTVSEGALFVNGGASAGISSSSSVTVAGGAQLGGNATLPSVTVSNGASLSPGSAPNQQGQLNVASLTLAGGSVLNVDLAGNTNSANNDLVNVTGNLSATGPVTVNIGLLNSAPAVNQPYTIMTAGGTISSGFVNNLVAGVTRYPPVFGQSGQSITVSFSNLDPKLSQLVWQSDGWYGLDQWSVGLTNQWLNVYGAPAVFYNGDSVTFNDSASSFTVNLSGTLTPASLTVSNPVNPYVFQGSGKISGATSLRKQGAASLTLGTTNDYTGGTVLEPNGGTLAATVSSVHNALGSGDVAVGANSTLELDVTTTANGSVTTLGNAFSGSGLLKVNFAVDGSPRNTYINNVTNFAGAIELMASAGAGSDKWNIAPGAYQANLLIDNNAQLFDTTGGTVSFPGISVVGTGNTESRGAIRISSSSAVLDAPISLQGDTALGFEAAGATISGVITNATAGPVTLTVGTGSSSGAGTISAVIGDGLAGGTLALTKQSSGTLTLASPNTFSGDTTLNGGKVQLNDPNALSNSTVIVTMINGLTFSTNSSTYILGGLSGLNNFYLQDVNGAPIVLAVGNHNRDCDYTGIVGGPGSLVKVGSGTFTLSGWPAYTGTTTVSNGTLMITGDLTGVTNTVSAVATGKLSGIGSVGAPVVVRDGGTLAPGLNAIGTLMLYNTLTLAASGFTSVEVDKGSGLADQVMGLTSVSYGGTLVVTNLSGTLALNDSFQIFSAASPSGNFSSIVGSPGPGLGWSFNPANGVLSVVSASTVAPAANFAALTSTTGIRPLPVTFTNLSTGNISTLAWDFGDGTGTNTSAAIGAVSHLYLKEGTYTVALTATGPGGANTATRVGYVAVNLPPSPRVASVKVAGGNLTLSGNGGPIGGGYNYYLLGSTNVALRLTNWTVLATNAFNVDGTFSTSLPVTPANPRRFYRLQMP